MLSLLLQFVLVVADAKAEREEVVGVLGSSVLLDPEITVDSSKNEILWTFKASHKSHDVILDHVPGVVTLEPSEQFKDRLQFNAANGALMINRLEASDEGNYIYSVDSKELKIIQLLVFDKVEEVIGILGSSVLLDPKVKVDPNKNEILWTFITSNKSLEVVLDHVPGLTIEPSEQFKNRLQFFVSSGGLMINSLKASDQGDYTFTVDGREFKVIQLFLHDKMEEVIGILNSSVLLDPELKVDPSKNEIVWTFIGNSILRHIPDHMTTEYSEQFETRLKFNTSNGALTINGLTLHDQGSYSFIVNKQEMKILQLLIFDELSEASIFTNIKSLGFTVELTCTVFGDSNVYQWQKNGGEISQHHQLTDGNRTLVIPSASFEDCGVYTCITTNPVSSIETNYTLILQGFSLKDIIIISALTAGQVISAPSLRSAMLPDQWRWKTLGGLLGYRFYFLSLWISNTLSFIAMYIALIYWFMDKGLSPLDIVAIAVMIIGLQLSAFYIKVLLHVTEIKELLKVSQMFRIWLNCKAACNIVLINCFFIAWIVSTTIFDLSTMGTVTPVLSIILPMVINLILLRWSRKMTFCQGDSIKDALIAALQFVGLMLPLVNVMIIVYLMYKRIFYAELVFFQTRFFTLVFSIGIFVGTLIPGYYSKDNVTFAASITMVVLLLVAFISFVNIWDRVKGFQRFRRWISVYNVGFLIVIIIATISWTAFEGLRPEDVGVAVTSMVGLVFSTAYAIIFMCWSRKKYPEDKQWWWCLNICNIVALVFILIAFICWIVSKDQSCKINIPFWFILSVSGVTVVITLSRSFPVCSRNKRTNENNRTEMEQDHGEVQESQTLSPGHEAEAENHPVG